MSDWYLQVHVYDRDVEYEILMQQAGDTPWEKGGDGTIDLANKVAELAEQENNFKYFA